MSTLSDLINADDDTPPKASQQQAASTTSQQQQRPYPSPLSSQQQQQATTQFIPQQSSLTNYNPQQSFQSQSSSLSQQGFYSQQSPQNINYGNDGPSSQFYSQPQQQSQLYPAQYSQNSFVPPHLQEQQQQQLQQQQEPIEIDDEEAYEPESPEEPPKPRTELDIAINGINGDDPLPATPLMICTDRLYQSFNNLILDFFPEPGLAAPQQSDIKETAEFNVKSFRDACQELTAEFTRSAVEWQLVNPQEYYAEEIKDLEKSIARQTEIQKRVEAKINAEINKPNDDKSHRI